MTQNKEKKAIASLLADLDIKLDGKRAWDIKVHNNNLYKKVLAGGSLAFGETYMAGWWDCKAIDQLIFRLLSANIDKKIKSNKKVIWNALKAKLTNRQTIKKSRIVGRTHYDVGNDLYKLMLDKRMVYSCGYWKKAKNLEQAQEHKLDLICKKLKLKKGMRVLDIGCGWGSFAKFAAQKYKVKVIGVTISKEQAKLARKLCKETDVEIRLQDYRNIKEKFDRIVSIGMFEHVGYKNYRTFMKKANECLKPDGLFLLHTIAGNKSVHCTDAWIEKYIFPNSMLPSAKQITKAYEGLFMLKDWHNFGPDYDKTLMSWHKNFNKNWSKIKHKYDEQFFRMWNYYLLSCAGTFRSHKNQLWQIVFSKINSQVEYDSIR